MIAENRMRKTIQFKERKRFKDSAQARNTASPIAYLQKRMTNRSSYNHNYNLKFRGNGLQYFYAAQDNREQEVICLSEKRSEYWIEAEAALAEKSHWISSIRIVPQKRS